jgi:prophage regulatory protein
MNPILRMADVKLATGLGRSTIYKLISDGLFPKPFKLTEKASGWKSDWIAQWLEIQIAKSTGTIDEWVDLNDSELSLWASTLIDQQKR